MPGRFAVNEIYRLFKAIDSWLIGYERIGKKNKPILKPDAPKDIVKMRDRLWELVLAEPEVESIEDFYQ